MSNTIDLYKISYCRGCGKKRVVAKESHMCAKCAMKQIINLMEFMSGQIIPPFWTTRSNRK